jgi:hypothetical protein
LSLNELFLRIRQIFGKRKKDDDDIFDHPFAIL